VSRTCCLSVHTELGEWARPRLARRRSPEGSWKPVDVFFFSKNAPKLFLLPEHRAWRALSASRPWGSVSLGQPLSLGLRRLGGRSQMVRLGQLTAGIQRRDGADAAPLLRHAGLGAFSL